MTKKIGIFGFFTLTGSMILTVYSYPVLASSGFALVFFLLAAACFYFIPTALISAEMATGKGWEVGGVFKWCGLALGQRWGFVAIFLQWTQITVGFLAMLYFIVGSLSYVIGFPELNTNPTYKFLAVIGIFWILTFINFKGTAFTSKVASIGVIAGVVVPIISLVIMVVIYLLSGNPIHVNFRWQSFIPDFTDVHSLTIFVTFILAYAGIEASAVHVNDMVNPKRNYPIAIAFLSVFAVAVAILGSLSIAIVIPGTEINMSAGVVQTFQVLLTSYHIDWLVAIFAFLLAIGAMAEVSSWIVGPSEGMFVAAKEGLLPSAFLKENKHNVPSTLIVMQALVVTIWAGVITLGGGGSNLSFMIAMALAVLIYLAMYVLLFLTYFKLKRSYGDVPRGFVVPGGKVGQVVIPVIGLSAVLFSIVISFFPPTQIGKSSGMEYEFILITSFLIVLMLPHLIYAFRGRFKSKEFQLSNLQHDHPHKWVHLRGRKNFEVLK